MGNKHTVEEAEKKIEECLKNNEKSLNLAKLGLTTLKFSLCIHSFDKD